jgi:hypothetical protein
MIFILMIELTGCYSTRIATSSDIKSTEIYFIHGQKINCYISDAVISDGILSGKTVPVIKNNNKINRNNIYISSDSVIKIEYNILSVPLFSITKIEQRVPDPEKTKELKTALIVGCSALTVLGIISTIMMIHAANNAANAAANGCSTTTSNLNSISCD